MTDIILALILVFVILAWAEHSAWMADRRKTVQKSRARARKASKNRRLLRRDRD